MRSASLPGAMTAIRRVAVLLTIGAALLGFVAADPTGDAVAASYSSGARTLDKAETQKGCWYGYGHAGPCSYGFDCSGLVYWAAHKLGVNLPRTTQAIMSSSLVYRIPLSSARRGDLMFYGSGHVEINTAWRHTTFGALHTGTRIGWHSWNAYWHPTMAYRIR
jgi:cell wall-associated NlpC family hydrolase